MSKDEIEIEMCLKKLKKNLSDDTYQYVLNFIKGQNNETKISWLYKYFLR